MTVFMEVVHRVRPITNTAFDAYVEAYGSHVVPAFARHGFDLLGAWKRSTGVMNEDLLLMRFENMAAYEQASRSLRSDREMGTAVAGLMEQVRIEETASLAYPVPYATEQRLEKALAEKPEKPRQYARAELHLTMGGQAKAYELIGKLADTVEERGAMQLVTAYETTVGRRGTLTDLWILPRGLGDLSYRSGDPLGDIIGPLREVAPEESIEYLNPLPYSPLQ